MKRFRARYSGFAWGFVDQAFSSATTFGLMVLAGRALGPGGLAAVVVGFTLYLIALGFQRSLVTDPLVASSSALGEVARRLAGRAALMVVLPGAAGMTIVAFAAAALIGGRFGQGVFVVALWLPVALVQDFWRTVLFRDGRARAAAANDGLWLVVMGILAPFAWSIGDDWAIVGCWGVGALVAALVGVVQTGYIPIAIGAASRWWRQEAWSLGRWLALGSITYSLATYGTVLMLVALLGGTAFGGLRAVQSLFSPLSLLGPAIALPGLPALVRARAESSHAARLLTLYLSCAVTALTMLYVIVFTLSPGLLTVVFGEQFTRFHTIVLPIGLSQIVAATATGFPLLLKAQSRGRALLFAQLVGLVATLAILPALASTRGLTGVAWGTFGSEIVASGALVIIAIRPEHERATALPLPAEQH